MPKPSHKKCIESFLVVMTPSIIETVKRILLDKGLTVTEKGTGRETVLVVNSSELSAEFCLHNLLLEIATVDRDQDPLEFDRGLLDFDYCVKKTVTLTLSKLRILKYFFEHEDPKTAIEEIVRSTGNYERIRILQVDGAKQAEKRPDRSGQHPDSQ